MRILHTADWHLGKLLKTYSRHEEQVAVLDEICEIADREAVDVVLIAGDLYDGFNPPTESIELFYKTLKRLSKNGTRPVVAIAGNHDSPERIEAPDPLARECGIVFAGYPFSCLHPFSLETGLEVSRSEKGFIELILPRIGERLRILITPYANEYRLKRSLAGERKDEGIRQILEAHWREMAERYCDENGVNVMLAHQYVMQKDGAAPKEPNDEEERGIIDPRDVGGASTIFTQGIPSQMQYVALGHLHREQVIAELPCPVVYSGSPLSYSYAEENQTKYVVIVEAEAGKRVEYRRVALEQGRKLLTERFMNIEKALEWLEEHHEAWVELTIVSEHYMQAADKKRLYAAHPRITAIIPEVDDLNGAEIGGSPRIDFNKGIEVHFVDYFKKSYKGNAPNEEIMGLFRECIQLD